jgi:predicted DsbA family dithiol-disulfide isomerase
MIWMGCSGTHAVAPPNDRGARGNASDDGPNDGLCNDYARRLCMELGPRSESCQGVLGVVALFPSAACAAGLEAIDTTIERIAELHKACETLAENVCGELGSDGQACLAIKGQLADIPPGQCKALLRDQERLIGILRERQAASGPLTDERWQELIDGLAPSFGPADASVVLVEFSDFQCPYCGQAAETLHRIKEEYGMRIRLVFRQFPLSFHPHAQGAAQAALAAHEQGKFWEFHDLLFAHQDALGKEALLQYAAQVGLNIEAFEAASNSEATTARVAEDLRLGEGAHVQGTPTMFINKQRIENAVDYESVSQAVEQVLGSAK